MQHMGKGLVQLSLMMCAAMDLNIDSLIAHIEDWKLVTVVTMKMLVLYAQQVQ